MRRPLAWGMVGIGGAVAAYHLLLLGVFLLSDGVTLWGERLRSDPEFFAYWTGRLPLLLAGLLVFLIGVRLLRGRTEVRGPYAG